MVKVHTRQKRYVSKVRGRNTKKGSKTFKSKESAKKYAEAKGVKNYKLVDLLELNPNRNKIKIVEEIY